MCYAQRMAGDAMLQVESGIGASGNCLHWTGSGGVAQDYHTVGIPEVCVA